LEQCELALKDLERNPCRGFYGHPFKQKKLLLELSQVFPQRRALLVQNLSQEDEDQIEGTLDFVLKSLKHDKAEFMLLLYPPAK
jgi:16S rRNA C1402 (ribose-2'-O) methylase RsmI